MTQSSRTPVPDQTAQDILGPHPDTPVVIERFQIEGVGLIEATLASTWFYRHCLVRVQLTEDAGVTRSVTRTSSLFSTTLPISTSMNTLREIAHRLIGEMRTHVVTAPTPRPYSLAPSVHRTPSPH